ncbi:hypothetical protein EVAR_45683_1 [Eumeta japonica]|uniref:Uncharacterized protein n=1 Tax=Eumeta variegata TaxID=151549 RepID=A0A4C1XK34_EUMVA|nr:hypothetical protein EVAR_45683_1 [Eumeta japonica]
MNFFADVSLYQAAEETVPNLTAEIEEDSRYKTLEANATLFRLLVDKEDGVSSSEVFDMLHSRDDNPEHVDLPSFAQDEVAIDDDVTSPPDAQAEYLQGAEQLVKKDAALGRLEDGSAPSTEPYGLAAGLMVGATCIIVCTAYIALIVWRRIELKRSGLKHELLRNEENIAETRIEVRNTDS